MDKVKVNRIDAYTWICPKCEYFNIHDMYVDAICENCNEEFEVEEE